MGGRDALGEAREMQDRPGMKRTTMNVWVDAAGFVGFAVLASTGILVRYVLPPGSGRRSHVWGLDRHEWGAIHFWIAVAFLAVLALHLALHWRWITAVVAGKRSDASGARFGLGLIGLLAVVALAFAPLVSPVERAAHDAPSGSSRWQLDPGATVDIKGAMTFREVAETTGVPVTYLLSELKLPSDTDLDDRIGSVGRAAGFAPDRVREIVMQYRNRQ
jgi:hypothetical protein